MKLSTPLLFPFLLLSMGSLPLFKAQGFDEVVVSCYASTTLMLQAQAEGVRDLVICPDTTIDIGIPTDESYSNFVDGDLPLTILGDNTTIQCGFDGASTNNCVLRGGVIQMATSPQIAQAPGVLITTNNLKVQGLTFTGTLGEILGVPLGTSLSAAVVLSAPGQNMVFEDVIFENLVANALFDVERTSLAPYEAFPMGAASVTVKDSVVKNSTYRSSVFNNINQTLILDDVSLENVFYDADYARHPDCNCTDPSLRFDNIIYATGGDLQIYNSDFTNITFLKTVVFIRGDTDLTTYTIEGVTGSGWVVYNPGEFSENDIDNICEDGLIVATSPGGTLDLTSEQDTCLPLITTSVDDGVQVDAGEEDGTEANGSSDPEDNDNKDDTTMSGANRRLLWNSIALFVSCLFVR